jgi:methyltransferase
MNNYVFILIISYVTAQRISELFISRRNEKFLKENGAVEHGKSHYKYIIVLHVFFIASLIAEYIIMHEYKSVTHFNYFLLILFLIIQILRFYTIYSLGKYWNTKILRIPGAPLVKNGAYRYMKHPNYMIVAAEILVLPLIFNCYITALVFSFLNLLVLSVRIRAENFALRQE